MPGAFERILVPMKIGLIGEEVLGTAIKLAEEQAPRSPLSTSCVCRSTSRWTRS